MGRPKERIPIFLELISGKLAIILHDVWGIYDCIDWDMVTDLYDIKTIKEFWEFKSDLRFSQVLVSLGIIPNIPGFWYYIEENEILEKLGVPAREYLLWGQNYDKDMNPLPNTLYKPIKDLAIDHIQAILDGGYAKNPKYIKCFEEELKLRNGNTTNSTETT